MISVIFTRDRTILFIVGDHVLYRSILFGCIYWSRCAREGTTRITAIINNFHSRSHDLLQSRWSQWSSWFSCLGKVLLLRSVRCVLRSPLNWRAPIRMAGANMRSRSPEPRVRTSFVDAPIKRTLQHLQQHTRIKAHVVVAVQVCLYRSRK